MACFTPLEGWRDRVSGGLCFDRQASNGQRMTVACGQCSGCRNDRARDWAVRNVHEESLDPGNSAFVTLTYDPKLAPTDGGLRPSHHTKFMKDLRERLRPKRRIRFFMCGEYGEHGPGHHPHYHYLIYGFDFPDQYYWTTWNGQRYFRSPFLESVWKRGFCIVGRVSVESAGYVSRYIQKKITGEMADDHYTAVDYLNPDKVVPVEPEFIRMSNRPGIGAEWFARFGVQDTAISGDFVTIGGRRYRVPRYYHKLLEEVEPDLAEDVRAGRKDAAKLREEHYSRLAERHRIFDRKISKLHRGFENGKTESLHALG